MLVIGIRESAWVNNAMVVLKLAVLAMFVGVGLFYVDPRNWTPFAPNGWRGIHQGAAIVFFAYIGFDAISTAAEETKDPQRNMPRGILGSLAVCTLIYAIVGLVATGLVPYQQLKGADPLARAFEVAGLGWGQAIVSFGAVVSMTAVLLVFQLGQPRIFFSMSRDGLLPPAFRAIHARFRTPHVTTIVTGIVVALGLVDPRRRRDLRPHEHRHAVRLLRGLPGRARAADPGPAAAAAVPRSFRVAGGPARGSDVRGRDVRPAEDGLGALLRLDGARRRDLLLLRDPPQPAAQRHPRRGSGLEVTHFCRTQRSSPRTRALFFASSPRSR